MTKTNDRRCAVCHEESLIVYEIGGLKRASCPACHHSQRIDIETFDYRGRAMGAIAVSDRRLASQVAWIAPYLPDNARVLEIGCAFGSLARSLRACHNFRRYDGIELSPARDQAAGEMDHVFDLPLPRLLDEALIERPYDGIISSHCLEHIEDTDEEMGAIRRVLHPSGGLLFLEVPNRSGNPRLAFDDNRSHVHFFSVSSLARLLARHGLEVLAIQTGAWETARFRDCIRAVAVPFSMPIARKHSMLSDHPLLAGHPEVVIWGAGRMADELFAHFFDPDKIAFFVDSDPGKHGTTCLGRPVRAAAALREHSGAVVLIGSIEYEDEIARLLDEQFGNDIRKVIRISELLA